MSLINGDDKKIGPAIGIDLGTWKCCVGIFRDGKVEIIENERGSKTTPSYVAFTESERIIGEDAKSQVALNLANTVYGVKRIIGRRFDDLSLQDIKDTFPFTVKQYDGKPFIEVFYKGKMERLCPEQVTAMFLTKMKHIAESHLGCEIKNAVISVPAHFNNAQRQATMDAGVIAGLNVLGLINEPTAAALAYRDNKAPTDKTICIVDLGGGTIDVSIIKMEGEKTITVVETHGNTSIGGMDFDQRLVKHFMEEFLATSNHNITGNFKALERLRLACEKLKHVLSLLPTTRIQLDYLAADTDFESSITRGTFEKLCHKDFNESLYSVLTKVRSKQLDRVVLVGGSTRIPYIQELLKKVFDKSLDKSVNPDEAVAHGAAIKAALLGHERSVQDMVVHEVTSHTYEIENKVSREVLFERNGHEKRKKYTIESKNLFHAHYDLSECLFDIKTNTEISRRHVGSMKPSDVKKCYNLQYDFTINDNGIFCGCLVDENACYRLPFDSDHLNTNDLPAMENQEKLFCTDKENEKSRLISLSDLEVYCFNKKQLVQELSVEDSDVKKLKQEFIDLCDETIDWLDSTPEATQNMCKSRKKELQGFLNILIPTALEVKEVKMNTKQQPKTVDQRAGWNSYGNNSENAGGLSSKGTNSGNGDFQDPLQCDPTSRSRTRQQTSQGRVDLADELNHKNKKKKLDELTKFAAQTSCMSMINTVHQIHAVPQQEPATNPSKYYNDVFLSRGLPFSEDHFGVPPGSSVGPRACQETGLLAEVHKPGWPTASGAIAANTGHQGGHNSRYPYSSQASGQQQHQGSHTYFRSQERNKKFSRDSGKTAYSSYDIYPELSSDEEQTVGYVKNRPPKKRSDSNFVVGFVSQVGSGIGSAFSSVIAVFTKLASLR